MWRDKARSAELSALRRDAPRGKRRAAGPAIAIVKAMEKGLRKDVPVTVFERVRAGHA